LWTVSPLLAALAVAGCSSDKLKSTRPKVVQTGGVVNFNGQPLEGALVTFTNTTLKVSSVGRTDASGKFSLTTFDPGDGAVPGSQQVSVSKVKVNARADPNVDRTAVDSKQQKNEPGPERQWQIPERYGSMATSGLTADVPESGTRNIVLELKGEPGGKEASKRAAPKTRARPD
jgi:hypothetical protein